MSEENDICGVFVYVCVFGRIREGEGAGSRGWLLLKVMGGAWMFGGQMTYYMLDKHEVACLLSYPFSFFT